MVAASALAGCAALRGLPPPVSTETRLAAIPTSGLQLEQPVTIYWNERLIPFIDAATDHDGAYALGIVHAHLRLGQIEILRRLSQGRVMELAGPLRRVREVEQALRIVDLGKTSHEVYARMPADSKAFLDAFVAGLNHYQQTTTQLPHEYALLGMDREPFEPHEILTIARLASVDVQWLVWFRLLALRERPDWPQIWRRALENGSASVPSLAGEGALEDLAEILQATPRVGSNSFAVAGAKSASGAALIASDPHLGVNLPNMWLLAGMRTPSYHAVGLMIPGLPFVAVGRNQQIAWGGTNLRSAASDLIDVSSLPPEQITTRTVTSRVRFWRQRSLQIRETPYGPIISDAAIMRKRPGEQFALKWIGHRPTDELTAMLRLNRATNWGEFRSALEGFAISAQNFVYADASGNVGQLTATHLPRRVSELPSDIVRPLADAAAWDTILTARDLPSSYNPPQGFVASGNNRPADTPYPIGYFYSGDDRILRMRELLSEARKFSPADLRAIQNDTHMRSAARLRDAIVMRGRAIPNLEPRARTTLAAIAAWNGRFDVDAKGAVAFQATVANLLPQLADPVERTIIDTGGSEYITYAAMLDSGAHDAALAVALGAAQEAALAFATWGDMHRLQLTHQFAMIPLIGGRYRFSDIPWPGSSETLWRADHPLSSERMRVAFGAQARHISDMANADSNWFALLGGNDGWFNSANFMDQVDAFRDGTLIEMPLRIETVGARFSLRTVLRP